MDLISGGNQTKGFSDTRPEYYCLLMNALHCRRQCHKKPSSDLPTCLLVWSYAISLMILLFTKIKKMISTYEALCFTDLASFLFYLFILVIHILIIHHILFCKINKTVCSGRCKGIYRQRYFINIHGDQIPCLVKFSSFCNSFAIVLTSLNIQFR